MGDVKFEDADGFTNQNQLVMPVIQYQGGKSVTVFPPKAAKKKAGLPVPRLEVRAPPGCRAPRDRDRAGGPATARSRARARSGRGHGTRQTGPASIVGGGATVGRARRGSAETLPRLTRTGHVARAGPGLADAPRGALGRRRSRSMTVFLQSVLSGLLVGGVYALIGIGLTIIFGVMRVINFAHGDLLMLGMYATWFIFTKTGLDPYVALLATAPLLFLWGAFLQKVFINRVLNALPQNQILLTIGLGLIMSNSMMLLFTSDYRILTTSYSSSSFDVGGLSVSQPLLYSFAHHRRDHRRAVLVPVADRHGPGDPRDRAGPRRRAAHGDQRPVDEHPRLRDRQRPLRRRRRAHRADLLHLPAGRQRLHPQGLRHRGARRDGLDRRRDARRPHHRA